MSRKTLRKIRATARVLAGVAFLSVIGFVGGMETGGSLGVGIAGASVSMAFLWLFAYIGGLFN